jgi:hypothetical protein
LRRETMVGGALTRVSAFRVGLGVSGVAIVSGSYQSLSFISFLIHHRLSMTRGVLLDPHVKMRKHPYQSGSFTYNSKYRRRTFSVTISHSPITLANLSPINLVSIFRCSSPPHNPVYTSRVTVVDPSDLVLSLSSHRHSYISLIFSSHFIDS